MAGGDRLDTPERQHHAFRTFHRHGIIERLRLEITAANNTLTHSLGRSPTVADVAIHLDITEEQVLEGLEGARAYHATSLSTPLSEDGGTSLGDTLGGDDHGFELAELRIALGPAMATLDEPSSASWRCAFTAT